MAGYIVNRLVIIFVVGAFSVCLLAFSAMTEQFVDAGSRKKIHFTETFTSSQDPGNGHEGHQLAIILPPNDGTIYDGSVTFTSSEPVQVFVLHEISPNDVRGQPVWTVGGETVYGLSLIGMAEAGSLEFTGAALGLHSPTSEFVATASVDGWIRGQPTEIIMQRTEPKEEQPLLLSRTNVPATIPIRQGLYGGEPVLYIMTDASEQEFAQRISDVQGWRVELAASIAETPSKALQTIFVFTNGVVGDGLYGYQGEVFSNTPADATYSALNSVTEVSWKKGQNRTVLESAQEILETHEAGRIEFNETDIVVNTPQIVWPGGQMAIRETAEAGTGMEYAGGQITEIDEEEMTVTFVAHRGWGPDGRTIYCIVTDATPSGPADLMGIVHSPTSASLITSSAAVDMFQFQNGIKGSGPLGFQGNIAGGATGDENYSPMWRVYIVEWNKADAAMVLETRGDIDSAKEAGLISVSIARPMNSEHVVNCPVIDPFQ